MMQHNAGSTGLTKLFLLLRNEGHRALNGGSALTLTVEILNQLNTECRRHSVSQAQANTTKPTTSYQIPNQHKTRQPHTDFEDAEWNHQVHFIKDFMLFTPNLKLICSIGVVSGSISLHRFSNLTTLNLQKVPVNKIVGLQNLRNTLSTLVVYKGTERLKDVLADCGGDMSVPMEWPHLTCVSLPYNSLVCLDSSLELIPQVEVLDLSHNSLHDCETFLKCLSRVDHLSLAYNFLLRAPVMSPAMQTSLTCLVLRANNIDSLEGLEKLSHLEQLDLGENSISSHNVLAVLRSLVKLHELQLDSNPLAYHKLHRQLTASCLAPQAATVQFQLDKKKLTTSELAYFKQVKTHFDETSSQIILPSQSCSDGQINQTLPRISSSSSIVSNEDSSDIDFPKYKKPKYRKAKSRHTPIMSLDETGEIYTDCDTKQAFQVSKPLGKLWQEGEDKRQEARRTREEIEELRKRHGPHWLQAIEDSNIFGKKKTPLPSTDREKDSLGINKEADGQATKECNQGPDVGVVTNFCRDMLPNIQEKLANKSSSSETDVKRNDTLRPVMASIACLAAELPTDKTDGENSFNSEIVDNATAGLNFSNDSPKKCESHVITSQTGGSEVSLATDPPLTGLDLTSRTHDKNTSDLVYNCQANGLRLHLSSENSSKAQMDLQGTLSAHQDLNLSVKRTKIVHSGDFEPKISSLVNPSRASPPLVAPSHADVKLFFRKKDEEISESMFAICPLRGNETVILALTASFLVEKDFRGQVTDKLELTCLTHMDWKAIADGQRSGSTVETDIRRVGLEDSIQLDLKFDYFRRDRQSRCYILDSKEGQQVVRNLQPYLDHRQEQLMAESRISFQCLKCNYKFQKGDITQLSNASLSKNIKSLQVEEKDTVEESMTCLKCGSPLVIELADNSSVAQPLKKAQYKSKKNNSPSSGSSPSSFSQKKASFMNKVFLRSSPPPRKLQDKQNSPSTLLDVLGSSTVQEEQSDENNTESHSRERSRAFRAPQALSKHVLTVAMGEFEAQGGELVCVEDYFSVNVMSNISTSAQLAEVTSSLQAEYASPGNKTYIGRTSYIGPHQNLNREQNRLDGDRFNEPQANLETNNSDIVCSTDRILATINQEISLRKEESTYAKLMMKREENNFAKLVKQSSSSIHQPISCLTEKSPMHEKSSERDSQDKSQNTYDEPSVDFYRSNSEQNDMTTSSNAQSIRQDSDDLSAVKILNNTVILEEYSKGLCSDPTEDMLALISQASESLYVNTSQNRKTNQNSEIRNRDGNGSNLSVPFFSNKNLVIVNTHMSAKSDDDVKETFTTVGANGQNKTIADPADRSATSASQSKSLESEASSDLFEQILSSGKKPSDHEAAEVLGNGFGPIQVTNTQASDRVPTRQPNWRETLRSLAEAVTASADECGKNVSGNSQGSKDEDGEEEEDDAVVYDFHRLSHQLTLHMMMSLFQADEEFVCKMQCPVVQYIIQEPYDAIFIMSTERFYIFKITSADHRQPPDQWLQCVEVQPIPELRFMDIGLAGQSLRLEFKTDCSSFTLITQNRQKTAQFMEILQERLVEHATRRCINSHLVVNEDVDEWTLKNLEQEILKHACLDNQLLFYCIGWVDTGSSVRSPVSFVVTSHELCLVHTNHQWPQPRLQAPVTVETVGKQFMVLERKTLNNVASMEVCSSTLRKIRLELFNQTKGVPRCWKIKLATRQSTLDFVTALSEPWAKEFGVELDVIFTELDF